MSKSLVLGRRSKAGQEDDRHSEEIGDQPEGDRLFVFQLHARYYEEVGPE